LRRAVLPSIISLGVHGALLALVATITWSVTGPARGGR